MVVCGHCGLSVGGGIGEEAADASRTAWTSSRVPMSSKRYMSAHGICGDDGAGGRVRLPEVRVAGGDHPADPLAVRGVVEEALDLRGHRFARIAAAIGGHDDDVRFAHVERAALGCSGMRNTLTPHEGKSQCSTNRSVLRERRREVDNGVMRARRSLRRPSAVCVRHREFCRGGSGPEVRVHEHYRRLTETGFLQCGERDRSVVMSTTV